MDMRRQMFGRIEHPEKSLAAGARRGFAGSVTRGNDFIPGPTI